MTLQFVLISKNAIAMINGLELDFLERPYIRCNNRKVSCYREFVNPFGAQDFIRAICAYNKQKIKSETVFLSWDYEGKDTSSINVKE